MEIKQIKFFEGIDSVVIQKIESDCSEVSFNSDQVIFKKGTPAEFLYILEQGKVELMLRTSENLTATLSDSGEVFGWSSIVEKGIYTATCTSKGSASVLRIPKKKIEAIFDEHPKDAIKFYQRLGSIFSKRISKVIE